MMDAYDQQKAYRRWLLAAGGNLSLVERALIEATHAEGDAAPTFDAVMALINDYRTRPEANPRRKAAYAT